jgi:predicted metal-dependent hydrolase
MNEGLKQEFRQRVSRWGERLNVGAHTVTLRPMRNKWASCSSTGRLTFNSELLALDTDLWDYVIVHELLHFSVPNHGRLWKSLMSAHLGNYRDLESRLQSYSAF